jgi:hypothetical protein
MLMRKEGEGEWGSPEITSYAQEANLQRLLAKSPDLLPGCDGSELVAVELQVPGVGYADLVCVSPTGLITVVECKLQSNPDIRRRVVGQVLAYASGLWRLSYEDFDAAFSSGHGSTLAEGFEGRGEWDEEQFRSTLAANLEEGKFSLVLAVDSITVELKQIVSYLNTHVAPGLQVLAVELDYAAGHGVEILMPRTYGEETASSTGRPEGVHWTEDELMEALQKSSTPAAFKAAKRLFEFGRSNHARFYFSRRTFAQPAVMIWLGEGSRQMSYGLYAGGDAGSSLAVNFGWMRAHTDEPTLQKLIDRLRELPDPAAESLRDVDTTGFRRRPSFPIGEVMTSEAAQDLFEQAVLEVISGGSSVGG